VTRGALALVLHAHLPYVRHPEHDEFLEEYWFYEAAIECYLPLLDMMRRLSADDVPFHLTLNLSPTLLAMMRDPLLVSRLDRRIDNLLELCAKEIRRRQAKTDEKRLARMYDSRLRRLRHLFRRFCHRDIASGFFHFQKTGALEIITCAATHGFLPFLAVNATAARAQIRVGVDEYRRNFGGAPAGIWLPECAFYPGLDEMLAEHGIRFFVVETHGFLHAAPKPQYGTMMPVATPAGVVAFGRDVASAKQVWSSAEGYPGDVWYREFYRDIGHERPQGYIRKHLPAGLRFDTGLKYRRITSKGEEKDWYRRPRAMERTRSHAEHFVAQRVLHLQQSDAPSPLVVAPYDAELFGHWWFEGPDFLEQVFRAAEGRLRTTTLSGYLSRTDDIQRARLSFSSWGEHGYGDVWLNPQTDWIYPLLHRMADSMTKLAQIENPAALERRALNQAARELLLAQSSDWPFLIRRGGAPHYAEARVRLHAANFSQLERALSARRVRRSQLELLETRFCPFPELDYRIFRAGKKTPTHETSVPSFVALDRPLRANP
jgi:1,4-alpha-glucan branching enzyme